LVLLEAYLVAGVEIIIFFPSKRSKEEQRMSRENA
jgi:hypothetical protein